MVSRRLICAGVTFGSACLLSLSACTGAKQATSSEVSSEWMMDGKIVISRPAPALSERLPAVAGAGLAGALPESLLGFMPVKSDKRAERAGSWLSINLKTLEINLMTGEKEIGSLSGQGIGKLSPGTYKLLHKQRQPLWHAPDAYFVSRGLPVPPNGDKARLRRGALGEYVLFLNETTPIHSGPIWSDEVGGVRMTESDLAKLYNALEIGATIEVR